MLDNTFPIKENGKIIGAVSISKFIDNYPTKSFIDLSNMTSTYTDENGMYNINSIIGSSDCIENLKYKIKKSHSQIKKGLEPLKARRPHADIETDPQLQAQKI